MAIGANLPQQLQCRFRCEIANARPWIEKSGGLRAQVAIQLKPRSDIHDDPDNACIGELFCETPERALKMRFGNVHGEITAGLKEVEPLRGLAAVSRSKIDQLLADPKLYERDPARVATLAKERADAATALAAAEEQWLALSGEYESAAAG